MVETNGLLEEITQKHEEVLVQLHTNTDRVRNLPINDLKPDQYALPPMKSSMEEILCIVKLKLKLKLIDRTIDCCVNQN